MNLEKERAAIEDAYYAMQAIGPLVDRLDELEEEEARVAQLLEEFSTVVERRLLCRRCGARIPAATTYCSTCGAPLRRPQLRQLPLDQP